MQNFRHDFFSCATWVLQNLFNHHCVRVFDPNALLTLRAVSTALNFRKNFYSMPLQWPEIDCLNCLWKTWLIPIYIHNVLLKLHLTHKHDKCRNLRELQSIKSAIIFQPTRYIYRPLYRARQRVKRLERIPSKVGNFFRRLGVSRAERRATSLWHEPDKTETWRIQFQSWHNFDVAEKSSRRAFRIKLFKGKLDRFGDAFMDSVGSLWRFYPFSTVRIFQHSPRTAPVG